MTENEFWRDIALAHDKVATNHELRVTVERNGKSAEVIYQDGAILIDITETNTKTKEPLIAP